MTSTVTPTAAAEIQRLLGESKTSITDVLDVMAKAKPKAKVAEHKPLPGVPPVSDAQRKALKTVVARAEAFDFPSAPRVLTEAERADAIAIYASLKDAAKALTAFETTFKETFHGHFDIEAEAAKVKGLVQDAKGHYVTDGVMSAPGQSQTLNRETRGGNAVPLTIQDLQGLAADETTEWTHQDYLDATYATRVLDPNSVMALIRKKPALVEGLRKVARLSDKTTQIALRPVK